MLTGQKRRHEITNRITNLQLKRDKKQNKIQQLSKEMEIIANELNHLQNENKLLLRVENDPIISSLHVFLIMPVIEICKSYTNYTICVHCDNYHRIEFCPKVCLDPTRQYQIKYRFHSSLIECDKNYKNKKTIPIIFYDEDDNELWKWVVNSILKEYPNRVYNLMGHDYANDCQPHLETDYLEMQILTMHTTDKPPRIRKTPPLINFYWKNKSHIYFESHKKSKRFH